MSELFQAFLRAEPGKVLLAAGLLVALSLLAILAPVLRLEMIAWFLRRRGVGKEQIRKWALTEVRKNRWDLIVDIIKACRRGSR
jgi:hypothetical protein